MGQQASGQAPEPEDQARGQWYALLSRLFYAPADQGFLDALSVPAGDATADSEPSALLDTWREFQQASGTRRADDIKGEFDALFVGAGKAQVTPYTSAYAAPHAPDRQLLELRNRLGEWGLSRRHQVFEVEDHVSALCDAMRWLIEHGHTLDEQRRFFRDFVEPAIPSFCDAIERSPEAGFYGPAARLMRAFIAIEKDAFDLHTAG